MRRWGYGETDIALALAELTPPDEEDEAFFVHPDNGAAVRLMLALRTQWRQVGLSTLGAAELIRTGLDYAVLEPTARLAGVEIGPGDFARIQLMEAETLSAWADDRASRR